MDIRNIAVLAHIDAGKTTLSERILWTAGEISRVGNVEDGLAAMDYLPEEKEKGITIEAGISHFEWRGIFWNLIDAPGHLDFGAEADMALSAADCVVLVVSAVEGIQPQTSAAWEKLCKLDKPCIVFINKTDMQGAKLEETFWELEEKLGLPPVLLTWKLKSEDKVWDVLSGALLALNANGKEDISQEDTERNEMLNLRREACEAASLADDSLLGLLLEKKEIEPKLLLNGLQKLFKKRTHIFCYAGAAKKNLGVRSLLNGLSFFVESLIPQSGESGRVVKVRKFPQIGNTAIFQSFKDLQKDEWEKGAEFYSIFAQRLKPVQEILRGGIYAAKGIEWHKTDRADYTPLMQMRVECLKSEDWEQTNECLRLLEQTDPSIRITENLHSGSWTIHAMGEVQLDILLLRLKREFSCDVRAGAPSVEFREVLVSSAGEVENLYQTGDFCAKVSLSATPLPPAAEMERFTVSGRVPTEFQEHILSAFNEFSESGVLGKGTLWGVNYIFNKFETEQKTPPHVVKKACLDAAAMLIVPDKLSCYEPVLDLTVQCSAEFAGAVSSDLLARGAKILGNFGDGRSAGFSVNLKMSGLLGYYKELLSITRGSGNYNIKFAGWSG